MSVLSIQCTSVQSQSILQFCAPFQTRHNIMERRPDPVTRLTPLSLEELKLLEAVTKETLERQFRQPNVCVPSPSVCRDFNRYCDIAISSVVEEFRNPDNFTSVEALTERVDRLLHYAPYVPYQRKKILTLQRMLALIRASIRNYEHFVNDASTVTKFLIEMAIQTRVHFTDIHYYPRNK